MPVVKQRTSVNTDIEIRDFVKMTEIDKYNKVPKLPSLEELKNMVKIPDINIDEILSELGKSFDLSRILDTKSLKDLEKKLLSLLNGSMFGKGSNAKKKQMLNKHFLKSCGIFSNALKVKFNLKIPSLQYYAILAALLAMLCMGMKNAFSALSEQIGDSVLGSAFKAAIGGIFKEGNPLGGIDVIKDIGSNDLSKNAGAYVAGIGGLALGYFDKSEHTTKDPVSDFDTINSSLSNMDSLWKSNGGSINGLAKSRARSNEMSFDPSSIGKEISMLF